MDPTTIDLPRDWDPRAKSTVVSAISMARVALMHVQGWCANSSILRTRFSGERDAALTKAAVANEEARILRTRMEKIPPQRRPQYAPEERMAIIKLRASTGWGAAETARRFQIGEDTIASWVDKLDEGGPNALLALRHPINRLAEIVTVLAHDLKDLCPSLGTRRAAHLLIRGGLQVSRSTLQRRRKMPRPPPETPANTPKDAAAATQTQTQNAPPPAAAAPVTAVTAKAQHHVWHVDLTLLPTFSGWWVPWIPNTLAQSWPFCFWLALVLDHYTRSVVGWKLYRKQPTADEVVTLLESSARKAGRAPNHIISDQGAQFQGMYLAWCKKRKVKPRFGAVGQHGSIAIIERFWRSLKEEMLRKLEIVPLRTAAMAAELTAYIDWYHEHRPHQGLDGATPAERASNKNLARARKRLGSKPGSPIARGDPSAQATCVRKLKLHVRYHDGRKHLPIVTLRRAA